MASQQSHGAAMDPQDPAFRGQQHYTPQFLKVYDPLVLKVYTRWVWRCPLDRLQENYDRHVGLRHLDVGPGTGYFLERADLPAGAALTLLDPNPDVLRHASGRLAHLDPSTVEADVCKPLPGFERFDSAALNFVLHCLPGPAARKAAAVRHVAAVLAPDGVLFGATVLGAPRLHTRVGRAALRNLNRKGIFDNREDTAEAVRHWLGASFEAFTVEVVGSVAVLHATTPRRAIGPGGEGR